MTRNAVIGKAHRLGLSGRPTPTREIKAEPEAPRRPLVTGPSGRACMWPVGDPKSTDFHFCNAPTEAGKPYCSRHCTSGRITGRAKKPLNRASADCQQ